MQDNWLPPTAAAPVPDENLLQPSVRLRREAEELRRGILNRVNEAPGLPPSRTILPRFG